LVSQQQPEKHLCLLFLNRTACRISGLATALIICCFDDVIKLLQFQNDLVLSLDIDCRLYSYLLGSTRTFFQISTSFTSPTFPSFHTSPTFPISPTQLATFTFFPFSYVLLSSTTYRDYLCNLIFENIHISYFLFYKDFKGTVVNQLFHSKDDKLCISL